jgi:ribonuclease BN (tRNA processing enzyme)
MESLSQANIHLLLIMLTAVSGVAQESAGHSPSQPTARTRVVLLGTGTPVPDPDRSGPATAIVVDDDAYLVDFGPGVVRRAESAALNRRIPALEPGNLKLAFVTHLHSDHTAGYSDLILTGWTSGRKVPLEVYGPSGLQSMTEHILQAYRVDIETRTNPDGPMRDAGRAPDGWKVNAHEIKAGVIYKNEKVTVTAFATKHAMESYGYRFETPDRTIVISGDTNPVEATINACKGCDVLIHEAQPLELLAKLPESVQSFVAKYHDRTACGVGHESQAEIARHRPHHQFSARDRPSEASTCYGWCGCALRFSRNASERDRLAVFRKIRNRKRPRRVLVLLCYKIPMLNHLTG